MACTVTVTGKSGAGNTVTAQAFTNVSSFTIDAVNKLLILIINDFRQVIEIASATTMTVTISSGNYTVTIS